MIFHLSEPPRAHFGLAAEEEFSVRAAAWLRCIADDRSRMNSALERALQNGEDYVIEYRNVRPDGSAHWIDLRARAAQRTPTGKVLRLVGRFFGHHGAEEFGNGA